MRIEPSLEILEPVQLLVGKSEKSTYHKLITEAIDDVFSALGDSCKQALYFHLECSYKIPRDEIPRRPQDFANALEEILGPGAGLIEIEIMKRLRSKVPRFKHSLKKQGLTFESYVESLSFSV